MNCRRDRVEQPIPHIPQLYQLSEPQIKGLNDYADN